MKYKLIAVALAAVVAVGAASITGIAGEGMGTAHDQKSIDGTYVLLHRELPDGTILKPPAVHGLLIYKDGHRNFNIVWTEADGTHYSISKIARYSFDGHNYGETNLFYFQNVPEEAGGMMYDLSDTSGTAVVKYHDEGFDIQLPLHGEPKVSFSKFGIIAEHPGLFKDVWERQN